MRAQRVIILFLVLGLLVGLEVVLMNRCTSDESAALPTNTVPETTAEAEATVTPEATPTTAPTTPGYTSPPGPSGNGTNTSNTNSSTPTPQPTRAPSATATPAPTTPPEPTTVPGTNLSSGDFSSYTGVSLNLGVSWQAQSQGGDTCRIYITGTVSSYGLQVMSRPVSISFGSYSTTVNGNSINATGNNMSSNQLFSTYLDVPEGTAGTMTVTWNYNGTYSNTSLTDIVASGNVFT